MATELHCTSTRFSLQGIETHVDARRDQGVEDAISGPARPRRASFRHSGLSPLFRSMSPPIG